MQTTPPLPSPVVLRLKGLCPDTLGYRRFRHAYHAVRRAAEHYAPGQNQMQAEYEEYKRVGYVLDLPDRATATAVFAAYEAVLAGRPMPWLVSP